MADATLLNLPNVISLSRFALAAAFVAMPGTRARVALIVVASFSDFLDGWLARRSGAATRWGALIDPVADRMFVFTAICVYLFEGLITTGQYFIMISRDIMTAVGFVVARWVMPSLNAVPFKSRFPGKVVTVLQLMTFIALLLRPKAADPMILVIAVVSLWAIIDYTWMLHKERAR